MAISKIGTDALASGVPSRSQLPAGTVLQVVNATYSTITGSSSSTYADTGLSASITPTSATNKILVLVDMNGCGKNAAFSPTTLGLRLLRGSTLICSFDSLVAYTGTAVQSYVGSSSTNYLDSPATTSSTTYKVQMASVNNGASVYINNYSDATTSTITLMEIAA